MTDTLNLLVGAVAALTLVRLWRARSGMTRGGLLLVGVPLGLLPAVAAATAGSWRLKAGFERIAETGSGGIGIVFRLADDLARVTLTGAIASAAVLAVTIVLALRAPRDVADRSTSARPGRAAMWAVVLLAVIGASAYVVAVAEREATATIARFSPMAGIEPPAPLKPLAEGSSEEWVRRLDWWVQVTTVGGAVLCVVIVLVATITAAFLRWEPLSPAFTTATMTAAVAIVGVVVWYCLRLRDAVHWTGEAIARLG